MSIQSKPVKKGSSYDLAIVKTENEAIVETEKRYEAIVKTEKGNEAIVTTEKRYEAIVKTGKIEKTEWKRPSDSLNARPISARQLPSNLIKPASQLPSNLIKPASQLPRKSNLNGLAVAPMPKANHGNVKKSHIG